MTRTLVESRNLISVAEDLEWLNETWWLNHEAVTDSDVRRGTAVLRRLLIDGSSGAILRAWRNLGFTGQPYVEGPDVEAYCNETDRPKEMSAALIAGGGRVSGLDIGMIGSHRVYNQTTGIARDADEGFAVEVGSIMRLASSEPTQGSHDKFMFRKWQLSDYLNAPAAIRRGHL